MPNDVGDRPSYSIPPPVPPIVALILIVVLDLVAPVEFLPLAVSLIVGIPLLVAGFGFWGWGIASLLKQGESPDPFKPTNTLLTDGALRYSRNPIYAGGTVGLLGLALLLDTATGAAVALILGLLANQLAKEEERFLEARFGDAYRQYRSRVRRWI
jgi:protein-S-isoprenylcysteine O-methyltransferase Ste14